MRLKKRVTYALVMASVCTLLGTLESASATHSALYSNSPSSCTSGETGVSFTLRVTNDGAGNDPIDHVRIYVDSAFTSLTASAPTDWSYEISTGLNRIDWTTTVAGAKIAGDEYEDFSWQADAPTVTESNTYYHDVFSYDDQLDLDAGTVSTTVNPVPEFPVGQAAAFAAGLLLYMFYRKPR